MSLKRPSRREFLTLGATGVAGFALGLTAEDSREMSIERVDIRLPRWTAGKTKIGLIADLHVNRPLERDRAIRAIAVLIAEKPDVIVIPGDFTNRTDEGTLNLLAESLDAVGTAKCPVFATLGNHDYGTNAPEQIARKVIDSPARLLVNTTARVGDVTIWGIDDGIYDADRHDLFQGVRAPSNLVTLFHEPDFVSMIDERSDLMLSVHSHGGQVCLPGGVPLYVPYGSRRYFTGYYDRARVPLYVTNGIGTNLNSTTRIFCPPQVSVLEIDRA